MNVLILLQTLQASLPPTMYHAMGPEEQRVPHVLQDTASQGGCLPGNSKTHPVTCLSCMHLPSRFYCIVPCCGSLHLLQRGPVCSMLPVSTSLQALC